MPKLEYFTVLDWIILISYFYATIPNFLSIISFRLLKTNETKANELENFGKRYGALSYVLIILIIIFSSVNMNHEFTNSAIGWMSFS